MAPVKVPYKGSYKMPGNYKVSNKKLKDMVRKEINKESESKFVTTPVTDFNSLTTVWTERNLCNPSQGLTANTRVGRKIAIKSVEINAILCQGSNYVATDDAWNVVRFRLGLYKGMTNDTPCQTASVPLDGPIRKDITAVGPYLVKTYVDKLIPLTVVSTEKGSGDGYTPSLRKLKYYKKFKYPIEVAYAGDTTTLPDKRLIMSMCSDSTLTTNPGLINGWILVRYTDI